MADATKKPSTGLQKAIDAIGLSIFWISPRPPLELLEKQNARVGIGSHATDSSHNGE
jgi:hypothetical protein